MYVYSNGKYSQFCEHEFLQKNAEKESHISNMNKIIALYYEGIGIRQFVNTYTYILFRSEVEVFSCILLYLYCLRIEPLFLFFACVESQN